MIDVRLLEIVACPNCHSALTPIPDAAVAAELRCTDAECGLSYPIRDGVPVLLVDEARGPSDDEVERAD